MLEGCFGGHWGLDGLKSYMRYSAAGGYQDNGENTVGLDYCITADDGFRAIGDVQAEMRRNMEALLASEGHRAHYHVSLLPKSETLGWLGMSIISRRSNSLRVIT